MKNMFSIKKSWNIFDGKSDFFIKFSDFLLAGEGRLDRSGVDLEAFHTVSDVSEPSTCSPDIIDRISKEIFFHVFWWKRCFFWIQKVPFRKVRLVDFARIWSSNLQMELSQRSGRVGGSSAACTKQQKYLQVDRTRLRWFLRPADASVKKKTFFSTKMDKTKEI